MTVAKLSLVLKQDEVLTKLCRTCPTVFLKLRRTSRIFQWRLDDGRLQQMQQTLIDELHLAFADLHELCERGDVECAYLLLSQGMSAKMRDAEGATLLQKATHSGKVHILKLLMEKAANLNAKGAYGYSPLHEACYLGHPDVCSYLLLMKANVDALSKNGSTPLLVASREGHNFVCDALLKANADADDGGDKGWTPLSVAAGEGHVEVCTTLLKHGACTDGFAGSGSFERSALQEAAEAGHPAVCQLLLERRANLAHTFDEGGGRSVSALELAERNCHTKVVQVLAAQAG